MSTDPRLTELGQRLLRPESIASVRAVLTQLDELSKESGLGMEVVALVHRAVGWLQELSAADPESAVSVLIDDLLPRSLLADGETDRKQLPRYEYLFGEWLAALSEDHRHTVRQAALPYAMRALDGKEVRNALRIIGSIGYWEDDLLNRLDALIASRDDEVGDHALSVRAWLASPPEASARLVDDLHRRMERGPSMHLLAAAEALGTPATSQVIWDHWLSPYLGAPGPDVKAAEPERDMLFDLTLALLGRIAARWPDSGLSKRLWTWLTLLVPKVSDRLENYLALNGGLLPKLNLAEVVPELLRRAISDSGHRQYLFYLRLRDCAEPEHMAGWDTISPADFAPVRKDATTPTGMTGNYSTLALDHKDTAWNILLCRGEYSVLPSFSEALAGETSGHVMEHFLDLAACLAVPTLPQEVTDLLAGAPGRVGWSESERLIAQIGAIRAAHGAANREAFNALLDYRQVGPGVLLSLIDALAETTIIMLGTGDRSFVKQLLETAEAAQRKDTRGAAAGAVAILLERGHLTPDEVIRAAALSSAPATDPYARRELLFAFAARPEVEVPPSLVRYANDLLDEPPTDESRDPRPAALAVCARCRDSSSDGDFLARRLELSLDTDGVTTGPSTPLRGVVPYLVARYFVADPERFARAVAAVISEGSVAALSHLLPSVREVGAECPPVVVNALVARLRKADDGRIAELPLLRIIAAVAPDRLIRDGCSRIGAWLPHARVALADSLGGVSALRDALAVARFNLLVQLAGDGIYAVRRAAYRAAVACDPERLSNLVLGWASWHKEPGREGPRRRAAESAGWLLSVVDEPLRALSWDQEPAVREAYRRSMAERSERATAREYEARVLAVREPNDVVRTWRYGLALAQVGDDTALDRISGRLATGLPPSVRFWLSRVRKAVERRWNEVTRKWPEPWFARPGHLETFAGTIHTDNADVQVNGTLWLTQAELPSGRGSWGGWATSDDWIQATEAELLISGRRTAKILLTSTSFPAGHLVFSGNGAYPEAV